MKVPKMYKSSDRYNAGTDVIYDDDSKLQYAPFIYAGIEAGSQDDGGEEGEEGMVVTLDANNVSNISYNELLEAISSGKVLYTVAELENRSNVYYLTEYGDNLDGDYPYYAILTFVSYEGESIVGYDMIITATTADEKLTLRGSSEPIS